VSDEKYSRQILFAPIGQEGQEKLRQASVAVIGCGALGTAQASLLTRAGIGRLRLIDRDYVEESNLQRQSLFEESDAAQRLPKAVAAEAKLKRINSDVDVEGIVADVTSSNIEDLVAGFALLLDGSDNFETRYLVNDFAVKHGLPWIYGAVLAAYGVTLTVLPGKTACLSCLFPQPPQGLHETCDTLGVIGSAVAWVSAIQAAEALKLLVGHEEKLHGTLLACDVWNNHVQRIQALRRSDCPACGSRNFVYLDGAPRSHVSMCGRNSVQIRPMQSRGLDLKKLAERLSNLGPVQANAYLIQCLVGAYELTVFSDGRALIKGTQDPALARSLYARYVGS
jgi:molybdopterin-synthase adenylyltransferase